MRYVALKPGGEMALLSSDLHSEAAVSDRAAEFLFHWVLLEARVTLNDIFLLIRNNPVLLQIYRQYQAEDLLQEAFADDASDIPDDIDHLEFSWCWIDADLSYRWPEVILLAVSKEREEQGTEAGAQDCAKRRRWDVALCPERALAHLPLRFDESSGDIGLYAPSGNAIPEVRENLGPLTLGQIIQCVLASFSRFGTGQAREEFQSQFRKETGCENWHALSEEELTAMIEGMMQSTFH